MTEALIAETRSDFGKGAARRMRRDGKVPAVVYGHGSTPIHIALDAHLLRLTLRKKITSIEIVLAGKTETVAPRDLQIDPVTRGIEHVDLVYVTAAEAATLAREAIAEHARQEESAAAAIAHAETKAAARAEAEASAAADVVASGGAAPAGESAE
ncbi:MAG: 50S ribosomal protein L25 [Candidatus Nanopelagicales bacterium]|jgi:ribosomal protein L25 (general stress protein Ctc)|nr:50S ribosomal protein L25 [Candidatus Nanopelagicales bacterium]